MIAYPSSNLFGTVVKIVPFPYGETSSYKARVFLQDAEDVGWGKQELTFVDTMLPVSELDIKEGDRVSCRCFEHMGTDVIDGVRMMGYEMSRGFKKEEKPNGV